MYLSVLLNLKFGDFGIDYGIRRKYWPLSGSVSDINQNSGFGRSLRLGGKNVEKGLTK